MKSQPLILVINPGATSTKIGLFAGETCRLRQSIAHSDADLARFATLAEQCHYRLQLVAAALTQVGVAAGDLAAVVGRGGLLPPLPGGTYRVNAAMVQDLSAATFGDHAANLGAILAWQISQPLDIPAFTVDPVCVDELWPVARLSGLPELPRRSFFHALNMRAVARSFARETGRPYADLNLVTAHLGTGISLAAHRSGRMVDVVNPVNEGPFSADRCGGLPAFELMRLCFSGPYTRAEMEVLLMQHGGMYAHLGTKDLRVVEARIAAGDEQARLVLETMAYQVAKAVGGMAAALGGDVDQIILTGGMAYSAPLVEHIVGRVRFIAPVQVRPGEAEQEALAAGALRVLQGEEPAQTYPPARLETAVV